MNRNLDYLKWALMITGAAFLLIWPLMHFWPSGWQWNPPQHEYEQMIMGVYATLGIFLIWAAKNPLHHLSLIWFTIWSSIVHATIMLFQALADRSETAHLYGDIPALYLIALVLALLIPKTRATG